MDDSEAIAALVRDLQWQIEQMGPRGIKNNAGNPYNPSYYKRGLQNAIDSGGLAVVDYVKRYVHKPPSAGYRKLEDADSLDLACEALVADESKPYAHLFSEDDRATAQARVAHHLGEIERRKAATAARIAARREDLPEEIAQLRGLAAAASSPEEVVAINSAILDQAPDDPVALNRLGRAFDALGSLDESEEAFRRVIALEPDNSIAIRRLADLERRRRADSR
jgi:tetratricopeptide (TPR) repeat protein